MEDSRAKLIGCAVKGAVGGISAMLGVKLIYDGAEELELAYYDPKSDKLDMYKAATKAVLKCTGGIALSGVGGFLIGSAVTDSFIAGQNSLNAPVMISANTIEDAQNMIDNMKNLVVKEV